MSLKTDTISCIEYSTLPRNYKDGPHSTCSSFLSTLASYFTVLYFIGSAKFSAWKTRYWKLMRVTFLSSLYWRMRYKIEVTVSTACVDYDDYPPVDGASSLPIRNFLTEKWSENINTRTLLWNDLCIGKYLRVLLIRGAIINKNYVHQLQYCIRWIIRRMRGWNCFVHFRCVP